MTNFILGMLKRVFFYTYLIWLEFSFSKFCTFIGAINVVCFPRTTADVNAEPMGELKTMPSQAIFHITYNGPNLLL